MAIKIKKDGKVSNFIINSTDIKVLDVANKFKNKNLENVITDISDTEKVHFGDVDINKTGLWIDNTTNLDSSENNNVVDRIKNYFNGVVGDLKSLTTNSKDTIVNAINENTNDIKKLSNSNIFINDCFQIWQRGTEFTPDALSFPYVCDRWRIGSDVKDAIYVSKGDNSIKIKALKVSEYINFLQIIEDDTFNALNNKKVTVTFKLKNKTDKISQIWGSGIDTNKTIVYHTSTSFAGVTSDIFSATIELKSGLVKNEFGIQFKPTEENQEIEIMWAKFEVGEKATPFIPRSYGEELALCQRYYQVHTVSGVANTPRVLGVNSRLVTTMRIKPTASYGGIKSIHQHGVGEVGATDDILESETKEDRVDYVSIKTDKFLVGHTYNVECLYLDSEIY